MKTAIGGTWILGLVMVFMLIFVSYLAVSLNYSRAFQLNSGVISILERQEGHCGATPGLIQEYLLGRGYTLMVREGSCTRRGRCYPEGASGCLYCLAGPFPVRLYDERGEAVQVANPVNVGYFRVTLFFRFDLPIIGNVFTFPVSSRTRPIHHVVSTPGC